MSCGTAQYQERSSQLKISFKGGSESRVSAWLLHLARHCVLVLVPIRTLGGINMADNLGTGRSMKKKSGMYIHNGLLLRLKKERYPAICKKGLNLEDLRLNEVSRT